VTVPISPAGENSLYAVYAAELREHAVDLVWLGYLRLQASSFVRAEEDVITGELVKEMKNVLEDPVSPPSWAEHYSVNEQQRANVNGKQGKGRPIIDVEFERHCRGKRPRIRFEAKRLRQASGVGDYLGEEGLAAFLSGYYPIFQNEAGMLGYVQDETPEAWAQKLSLELATRFTEHRVRPDGQWSRLPPSALGAPSFYSGHIDFNNAPTTVTHMLLAFTE